MTVVVSPAQLERKRREAVKSREGQSRHHYFQGVAEARYVLRKVFRMVEEEAKKVGLDPLAHQALIQVYGSPESTLRVKEIAERLDISPAFASSLIKTLVEKRYLARKKSAEDQRVAWVSITKEGKRLLHAIDEQVQMHVDYFNQQLEPAQREAAISILLFYVGVSLGTTKAVNL
jgi:DNA-binding MarR family transcriptional regulator